MSGTTESRVEILQMRLQTDQTLNNRNGNEMQQPPQQPPQPFDNPRPGSGRRPNNLGEMQIRRRMPMDLQFNNHQHTGISTNQIDTDTSNKLKKIMKLNGLLKINGVEYKTDIKDLEDLGELGNGTSGHVVKMRHKASNTFIAVKQMRRTGNEEENKRIIMDLDVVLKSHDCEYIVQCLGCFINESDVWICMELMAMCFDKLQKKSKIPVPENILGKVTVATVKALAYLKDKHGVIHRDVKPSNILIDERGNIKLCDFGISGRLVDSKARTRSAGCAAYMAPERIEPDPKKPEYDIRADVWSLGITLVELATGSFPYSNCATDFEVLAKVLESDPPALPAEQGFSLEFQSFVNKCLLKNYRKRPKYPQLLEQPFIKIYEVEPVDVATWFASVMEKAGLKSHRRISPSPIAAEFNRPKFLQSNLTNYLKSYTTPSSTSSTSSQNTLNSGSNTPSPLSHQSLLSSLAASTKSKLLNGTQNKLLLKNNAGNISSPSNLSMSSSTNSLQSPHHNQHIRPLILNKPPSQMSKSDIDYGGKGGGGGGGGGDGDGTDKNEADIVTEMNKMYVRSPFAQRKQELINVGNKEYGISPKKESTFSQIGQSIIRNLTNSPFIQRKNSSSNQPSSLPILQSERSTDHNQDHRDDGFWNYAQYHPNDGGVGGQDMRNLDCSPSPLMGRKRNQSTITKTNSQYGNTSPIVLQRFYHQQSQYREKYEDDEIGQQPHHQLITTNPFHNFHNHHHQQSNSTLGKPQYRYSSSPQQPYSILSTSPSAYGGGGQPHNFYRNERTTQSLTSYTSPTSNNSNNNKSQIPKFQHQIYQQQQQQQQHHLHHQKPTSPPLQHHHQSPNLNTLSRPVPNGGDKVYQFYDGGGEGMASGFNDHQPNVFKDSMTTSNGGPPTTTERKPTTKREDMVEDFEISGTDDRGVVKKRFASYVKLNLNSKENEKLEKEKLKYASNHHQQHQNQPNGISCNSTNPFLNPTITSMPSNIQPPSPHVLSGIERRHRSPDPPPRFNRGQSPLMIRRNLIEYGQIPSDSPLLGRRLITSSPPPLPPPRRGCDSVPGSPQHFRTRLHYTPEPQRRIYRSIDQ